MTGFFDELQRRKVYRVATAYIIVMSVHVLRLDPVWDPLRKDPRFQALIDRYALNR